MIFTENTEFIMLEGSTIPERVMQELTYNHNLGMQRVLDKNGEPTRKMRMKHEERKLYQLNDTTLDDGSRGVALVTLPGFASRIRTILKEELIKITRENTAKATAIPYDLAVTLELLRPFQEAAATAAMAAGGGVLQCPTGFGKTVLVSEMIRGYSTHHMERLGTPISIFISPTIDLCNKNYEALKSRLPDRDVGVLNSAKSVWSEDVMVVTPDSVHHIAPHKVGLVFFDEVHTVTYPRASKVLAFTKALKFGLSATPEGRSDNADILIEAIFGPVVYRRTVKEATDDGAILPVVICWVPMPPPQKKWYKYAQSITSQRHGIWRNNNLNSTVAQLMLGIPQQYQTLALVDKLEQMNNILVAAGDHRSRIAHTHASTKIKEEFPLLEPRSKKLREQIYKAFESGTINRCIANGIYKTGVDFPNLALLIKADCMGGRIAIEQIPGRTTRLGDGTQKCGVVVDFWPYWDTHPKGGVDLPGVAREDGTLMRNAKKRHKVYKELGFIEVNAPTADVILNALRGDYV